MAFESIKDRLSDTASDVRKISDRNIKNKIAEAPTRVIEEVMSKAGSGIYEAEFDLPSVVIQRVVRAVTTKKFTGIYYKIPGKSIFRLILYWGPTKKSKIKFDRNTLTPNEWITLVATQLRLKDKKIGSISYINGSVDNNFANQLAQGRVVFI